MLARILVSFMVVAAFSPGIVLGQWQTLDGERPVNPVSGAQLNPQLFYDHQSGLLLLRNIGPNNSTDSIDNSTLLGDDVGMINMALSLREAPATLERTLGVFSDGINWLEPAYADGFLRLNGNALGASFLPISEPWGQVAVMQLPAGLFLTDFFGDSGKIEMEVGINFGPDLDGMTIVNDGNPLAWNTFTWGAGLIPLSTTLGDFDGDYEWSCTDIDGLVAEIAAGTNMYPFDTNFDEVVDLADLEFWLLKAGVSNGLEGSYLPGDANLDGQVDVADFNIWSENKFTETAAWCSGDFNADGFVDVSDWNIWNDNQFTSSFDAVAVPEPGLATLLITGLILLLPLRRRGR